MSSREVVAIIPARGGSKSIERKNLAEVGGMPLVARAVGAARAVPEVSRVLVTTDDADIAIVAAEAGAEIIERPDSLAGDDARSIDAVVHAIEVGDVGGDTVVVMLQPTSPFTTGEHIAAALGLLTHGSVVSVVGTDHHPLKSCLIIDGVLHPVAALSDLEAPRQQLPDAVRPNGAIYIAKASALAEQQRFFIEPVVPYRMAPEASIDIDTPEDLARANEVAE